MSRRLIPMLLPILLGGCFDRPVASVENLVRPVQVVRVSLSPRNESRRYSGIVRPRHEADIGFRVGGRLIVRNVDLGARVAAGAVLGRLDPTELELALRSAQAALAGTQAQAVQAQADAARSHILRAQGWTAAAADEIKQATARLAAQKVEAAQAALALARNQLDDTVLHAPNDGVVTAVAVDPGTMLAVGQPVLRLASADGWEIEVQLPETAVADVATQRAEASFWARPDSAMPVTLRELSPASDPKLRTYTARFSLPAPPAWLALGMTATVRLTRGDAAMLALLPADALTDRGQGPMVWVVDPAGKLEARPVRIAALRQESTLVAGLHAGELVVGLGVQKLDPALRVRVADIRVMQQ